MPQLRQEASISQQGAYFPQIPFATIKKTTFVKRMELKQSCWHGLCQRAG